MFWALTEKMFSTENIAIFHFQKGGSLRFNLNIANDSEFTFKTYNFGLRIKIKCCIIAKVLK